MRIVVWHDVVRKLYQCASSDRVNTSESPAIDLDLAEIVENGLSTIALTC